jgi:hypothetical protein
MSSKLLPSRLMRAERFVAPENDIPIRGALRETLESVQRVEQRLAAPVMTVSTQSPLPARVRTSAALFSRM